MRRVAIAGILAMQPDILVLDEPELQEPNIVPENLPIDILYEV